MMVGGGWGRGQPGVSQLVECMHYRGDNNDKLYTYHTSIPAAPWLPLLLPPLGVLTAASNASIAANTSGLGTDIYRGVYVSIL